MDSKPHKNSNNSTKKCKKRELKKQLEDDGEEDAFLFSSSSLSFSNFVFR